MGIVGYTRQFLERVWKRLIGKELLVTLAAKSDQRMQKSERTPIPPPGICKGVQGKELERKLLNVCKLER